MPGLARKLLICAAIDGLIIQPQSNKGQRPSQSLKISYGDAKVSTVSRDQSLDSAKANASFEAFGVIGLFTVSRLSYLITITGRQEVAQVRGFPIYVITDVALTPCASATEAEASIAHTAAQQKRAAAAAAAAAAKLAGNSEDTDSDDEARSITSGPEDTDDMGVQSDREENKDVSSRPIDLVGRRSSIAEDVIKRKGSYGRFAQRWFGNKGVSANQNTPADTSSDKSSGGGSKDAADADKKADKAAKPADPSTAVSTSERLLPKLLRMAYIWFGSSKSFYFSYDIDVTRSIANQSSMSPDTPLHRIADPMYFWNANLLQPLDAVATDDGLLLPIMQGFVGQREFIVDRDPPQEDGSGTKDSVEMNEMTSPNATPAQERSNPMAGTSLARPTQKKYMITLISRRSIKRAGLRYLRRGIDDDGYTANSVETEQILSAPDWVASEDNAKIFSFVQIRGSIPLFFTQSPYSLKPTPVLQHSPDANLAAFSKHFQRLGKQYGALQLVNLVEKHNVEAAIGGAYEKTVERYNESLDGTGQPLSFEWFDFHAACRGMKFENVSLLLNILGATIEGLGSTVEKEGKVARTQEGVLRTNCMDCLDRTNVCQSSFAKFMLDLQLKEEGFDMSAQMDQVNSWFNTLWADNGDAISKQYASTAAMKGDYTRTRKRNYRGTLTDLGISLTRYYNGMVNDYFSQAAIDFLLGNASSMVFEEFEANMKTKDPAVDMQRMRDQAIETSRKIVIENDKEDLIGGWTMLTPHVSGTVKTQPFQEVVLLVTDMALYLCRFDWNLDKVSSFERVDLAHVVGIKVGTYITSAMSSTQADEKKNVGLIVTYQPGKDDVQRTNTRSLSSNAGHSTDHGELLDGSRLSSSGRGVSGAKGGKADQADPPKKLAFKAHYAQSPISDRTGRAKMTEVEQVDLIAAEIERLALTNQPLQVNKEPPSMIERADIISLAEAKRNTGVLEQIGHSLKKLVWAS